MNELEFRILGPLEVLRQGAPVPIPPGRPRALLGMLLVHAGRVMATDVLLDELWRGDPPATAGHALQVHVSKLRKLLEPDRPAGSPWQVLVTRQPGYVLAVPSEQCDAGRFEVLVGESGRALSDGRPADASRFLADALALWRGSVLADLTDEPFVTIEAARLEELRAVATERWADAELALGHHGELVSELEGLIGQHPFRERLWGQLMVALYRSGRPTDALHTYQRLRRMLDEEVGLSPSPELQRLETAILRHDPDLAMPREVHTPGNGQPAEVAPSLPLRLVADQAFPLAGRVQERASLEQAWVKAKAGGVHVVLLAGEPGIGKTRLATETALEIHRQGGLVLHGTCDEELAVPYQPFVEALRHLIGTSPKEELAAVTSERSGELTRLFPELSRLLPDLSVPQTADPETERYLLFSAVADLLGQVSSRHPGVLILDDLHWATKPTLLMLKHVVRSAVPMRLLIIGTYRDSEVGRGHPLTGLLAELRRGTEMQRLALQGLSQDDAVGMIAGWVGEDLKESELALARAVHAEAGGSPFFMWELVRHLVEAGDLLQEGDTWTYQARGSELGVPDSVREVILHRLSRLSELSEHVLTLGSVLGRQFDVAVLVELVGLDRAVAIGCLDEARRAALVREVEGEAGRYTFVHALIRHALYDELGPTRRMDLHRLVAETLESRRERAGEVSELARHWGAAIPATGGPPDDVQKAARYGEEAGRLAMAALAYEEAVSHFTAALKAARQGDEEARVCELLIDLGEAQCRAGDPRHVETLLDAGRLARRLGQADQAARAALANQRGVYSRIGDVHSERVAALQAALDDVGPSASPVRAKLLAALSTEVHFKGLERLELAREAVAMAREFNDDETLAQALAALWFAGWGAAAGTERGAVADELETVVARLSDRSLQFQAGVSVFLTATGTGDIARADQGLASCVQIAEELGQPLLRWRVTSLQVHRAMLAGQFDDAERLASESLALGELTGQPDRLPFLVTPMTSLRLMQGRPEEVEALVAPVLEQFPRVIGYPALLAWGLADAGRIDEARAILDRLRPDSFAGVPHDYIWLFSMSCLSRACARIGDVAAAEELYDLLLPSRDAMASTQSAWIGPVTHDLGLLAALLGRYDAAEEHFAAAVAIQDRIGAEAMVIHTRLEWARMLLRRDGPGDADRALTLLGEAETAAQKLGLSALVARLCALRDES